jgi:hypothetical protein
MLRRWLTVASICFTFLILVVLFRDKTSVGIGDPYVIDNMPLVRDSAYEAVYNAEPIEQRDSQFQRWLAVGMKISVKGASGSGTIVYFDDSTNYAYVQSCGHLWTGKMTAEEGKKKQLKCKVTTWYWNDLKLTEPRTYDAEVLYYNNVRGQDVSLVRFRPDWRPDYIPIAPQDFQFTSGMRLHSVGCDLGKEVAHYDVQFIQIKDGDIVTTENSPRPGRSGGGLMTDNMYVGICWGTSSYSGDGVGFFTPLKTLRDHNKQNGFEWLNDAGYSLARQIPIKDHDNPSRRFPPDYVPLPKR